MENILILGIPSLLLEAHGSKRYVAIPIYVQMTLYKQTLSSIKCVIDLTCIYTNIF